MFIPFQVNIDEGQGLESARRRRANVVYGVMLLCIVIHGFVALRLDAAARLDLYYRFGATKFDFHPWSPLTCTLLHGGWGHLIGNLYFLWIYGRAVERYVGIAAFLALYAVAAYVSVGVHLLTVSALYADEPTIGASGVISAVLGTFLVFWPKAKLKCLFFSILSFRPIIIQPPAYVVLGLWFAGQLIYTLQLVGQVDHVAFWAHVAGFAGGAGFATLYQQWREHHEEARIAGERAPLKAAWKDLQNGNITSARSKLRELSSEGLVGDPGTLEIMLALTETAREDERDERFLRAFCRARDYRDDAMTATVYLLWSSSADPAMIPPFVHYNSATVFRALGEIDLALLAFRRAVETGYDKDLDVMERSVRHLLGRRGESGRTG